MGAGILLLLLGLSGGIGNTIGFFGDPTGSAEAFFLNSLVGLLIVGVPGWFIARRWLNIGIGSLRSPLERAARRLADANVDTAVKTHVASAADLQAERRGRKVLWLFDSEEEFTAKQLRSQAKDAEFERLSAEQDYRAELRRREKPNKPKPSWQAKQASRKTRARRPSASSSTNTSPAGRRRKRRRRRPRSHQ